MNHKLALLGFGTVGQGVCRILKGKKDFLKAEYGFEYRIVAVSDCRLGNVYDPEGLDTGTLLLQAEAGKPFASRLKEWDNLTMIRECGATTILELTPTDLESGGAAMAHCRTALGSGINVVTSNKGPAALAYREFKTLAEKNGALFLIEGTVCAGTPVINLAAGPLAGCTISGIRGILNGTTNFILCEMEKGKTYEEALHLAQEMGYAEADPSGDVEGGDARGKTAILANIVMGGDLKIRDIPCRGITGITPEDIRSAAADNMRWKLIGTVENRNGKISGRVAPEKVPQSHPLAGVGGAENALTFSTDLLGEVTITGPGAGKVETGFAILNDLLEINKINKFPAPVRRKEEKK